jgi:hypothetical protein
MKNGLIIHYLLKNIKKWELRKKADKNHIIACHSGGKYLEMLYFILKGPAPTFMKTIFITLIV